MATLRKANSYSHMKVVPYTRFSKKKNKAYVKTVPPQKVVKFWMGDQNAYKQRKFPFELTIIAEQNVQIRSNALEAARQYVNKQLDKLVTGQYFFRVIPYPHHIQRENKMLTGAGADRMQTGMQLSFGKTIARAALVKKGTPIFSIATATEKGMQVARALINKVRPKLPSTVKILSKAPKKERIE